MNRFIRFKNCLINARYIIKIETFNQSSAFYSTKYGIELMTTGFTGNHSGSYMNMSGTFGNNKIVHVWNNERDRDEYFEKFITAF